MSGELIVLRLLHVVGGVVWVGGSAPTLATTGYTVVELWKVGSTIYGAHTGDVA